MGVETPEPPIAMNVRRPEGRPAAGIITIEKVITGFHGLGANILFMYVSAEHVFFKMMVRLVSPYHLLP